jgi:hypothetical protein
MGKWIAVLLLTMAPWASANDAAFHGLLRARDLTPFGYQRLDMRPATARTLAPGDWGIEADVAYQNTWAMSPEVERYLTSLPGRRELGPTELQAIRDLPGENYLVDLELSQFDVTLNYQLSDAWGAYLILSSATFGSGFLDGTIEEFHEVIGSSTFGRPAASRNDTNLLFDLKSSQYATFEAPGRGGLLDPVMGLRYSKAFDDARWKLTLESAIKIPLADRDAALSTGRTDVGVQMSLQRYWGLQAFYFNLAAVYYAGADNFVPEPARILPTLVLGYELRVAPRTSVILQGYVSDSVYEREQTDLHELLATKFQMSAGVHHRWGAHLISFALTENLQNINNTPDVGIQLGWSFNPALD